MNRDDLTYIFNEMISSITDIRLGISSKIIEKTKR